MRPLGTFKDLSKRHVMPTNGFRMLPLPDNLPTSGQSSEASSGFSPQPQPVHGSHVFSTSTGARRSQAYSLQRVRQGEELGVDQPGYPPGILTGEGTTGTSGESCTTQAIWVLSKQYNLLIPKRRFNLWVISKEGQPLPLAGKAVAM